jgi:hypothetical protein
MVQMQERVAAAKARSRYRGADQLIERIDKALEEHVDRESKLHAQIIEWCGQQWPRWQFRHERMDKATRGHTGDEDFVVFGPFPLCFLVEGKAKGKKPSKAQLERAAWMRCLGWDVPVVRSMEEFHTAREAQKKRLNDWKNAR